MTTLENIERPQAALISRRHTDVKNYGIWRVAINIGDQVFTVIGFVSNVNLERGE
jgi:hypothetical protein